MSATSGPRARSRAKSGAHVRSRSATRPSRGRRGRRAGDSPRWRCAGSLRGSAHRSRLARRTSRRERYSTSSMSPLAKRSRSVGSGERCGPNAGPPYGHPAAARRRGANSSEEHDEARASQKSGDEEEEREEPNPGPWTTGGAAASAVSTMPPMSGMDGPDRTVHPAIRRSPAPARPPAGLHLACSRGGVRTVALRARQPGRDEAGLVGEHHELHPVAGAELAHHRATRASSRSAG